MSKQTYRVCFCFRRRFRLAASEAPADIKALFDEYSEKGVMCLDALRRFMVEEQREENATVEDAQAVLDSLYELKHLNIFHRRGLNLEAFFRYLFADMNSPLNPKLGFYSICMLMMTLAAPVECSRKLECFLKFLVISWIQNVDCSRDFKLMESSSFIVEVPTLAFFT